VILKVRRAFCGKALLFPQLDQLPNFSFRFCWPFRMGNFLFASAGPSHGELVCSKSRSLASALAFTLFAMNTAISLSLPGSLLKPLFFSSHCLSQCVGFDWFDSDLNPFLEFIAFRG
jgi:hypothetical protein